MQPMTRGRYTVREADGPQDLRRAQELRTLAFGRTVLDSDPHDDICTHVLIEEDGTLVACLRLLTLVSARIGQSYSAQFYDLGKLAGYPGPLVELGRFCLSPAHHDPDILRVAWGAVTKHVEDVGAQMLFGCSSFHGTDPAPFADTFALLRRNHIAPADRAPGRKADRIVGFEGLTEDPDMRAALRQMPPLLRTYLAMGGWVSDHAVVDPEMGTLHVFTGVEIRLIPPERARLLRAVAG